MTYFRTPTSVGVWQTFVVMAAIYFVFMMSGAFAYRVPDVALRTSASAPGASADKSAGKPGTEDVHYRDAIKTKQFWLIWAVLCLNVSAGIGVIGMASPMLQEIFGASAAVAAGFTGLISLFNIGGRFFWASLSDYIGRRATYATFFLLGVVLYASAPSLARAGSQALFVLAVCVIVSMYGGGFATIPAYLADTFGTQYVGAIHGRLLTAWSTAGIIGPVLVNYIREAQLAAGVPRQQVYDFTLYILAGLLVLGLIANAMVKAQIPNPKTQIPTNPEPRIPNPDRAPAFGMRAALAWTAVGVPLAWGTWITLTQAFVLFSGGR
jgi:nitrate/nitrite transporter NarK